MDREFLAKIAKEELLDFLVEYAETDARFANAVNVRFSEPDFEEELIKIEGIIDDALIGVADWSRVRDSWGNVDICIGDITTEICQRASQGHIRLAFAETELLYLKLLELLEYQGECEISMDAEYCLELMSQIADKAFCADDKEYIFKRCIALSICGVGKDYGADYEPELLTIALRFATVENRADLEQALIRAESSWRAKEIKLISLELAKKLDGDMPRM